MRSVRSWISISPLVGIVAFVSCGPAHEAAMQLDKVARSLDRYGFANISAPFLAEPSDSFSFNLDKKASEFFDMAFSSQGGVRNFSAEALDVQIAIRVNIEQALSTIAQFQNAKSIASFRDAQRRASLQKELLQSIATANPDIAENSLLKSTIGMLGVVADQSEPSTDALPGFVPTSQPIELGAPIPEEDRIALRAVGSSFTPGLAFPQGDFKLTAREALLIASGDSMTQSLLQWFMKPRGNKLQHYELFFCPLIVSVQPGTVTRDGYLADITVDVDLARTNTTDGSEKQGSGGLVYLSESFPHSSPPIHVAGVFPVIDSQVLDLVNSRRQLFSLAFQLSMLGFGAQADAFIDYARRLEQDAQTKTALTVGSAYTIGSTAFGFRVEPKFVASKDPTRLVTEPGDILESKTFPAMAAVLVHTSYLRSKDSALQVRDKQFNDDVSQEEISRSHQAFSYADTPGGHQPLRKNDSAKPNRPVAPGKSKQSLTSEYPRQTKSGEAKDQNKPDSAKFDYLVFRTSVRWTPAKAGAGTSSFTETEAWQRADAIDKAEDWITTRKRTILRSRIDDTFDLGYGGHVPFLRQLDQLASRANSLRKMALDSQTLMRVWHNRPADCICISDVLPRHGWIDQYTVLTIRGTGFSRNVDGVSVGGVYCSYTVPNDRTLLVLVPPWNTAKARVPDDLTSFANLALATRIASEPGRLDLAPWSSSPLLATGNQADKVKDDKAKDTEKPALTDSEKIELQGLAKLAGECNLKEGDVGGKWEIFKELQKKERERKQWESDRSREAAARAAWAPIAIAARVPVKRCRCCQGKNPSCCEDKKGANTCKCPKGGTDQFPCSMPGETYVVDSKGCSRLEGLIGWIVFDNKLPSGAASTSKGNVTILRNEKTGQITGVSTGDGGFANGAQLLQLIEAALANEQVGDVSLKFSAGGGLEIGASGTMTTSQPASP